MKVAALKGKARTIPVTVPGDGDEPDEVVMVTYRPGAINLEMSDKIQAALTSGAQADITGILLTPILEDWDLTEDVLDEGGKPTGEERPFPCDAEHIKIVPLAFLGLLLSAIQEDSMPTPTKREPSDDGSQPTDDSASAQTGTSLSEQPTDSTVPPGSSSSDQRVGSISV